VKVVPICTSDGGAAGVVGVTDGGGDEDSVEDVGLVRLIYAVLSVVGASRGDEDSVEDVGVARVIYASVVVAVAKAVVVMVEGACLP